MNDFIISPDFNLKEFQCPCCKLVKIANILVIRLQLLRDAIREPLFITSGYRCDNYNHQIGGVDVSYHKAGLAADVTIKTERLYNLYVLAMDLDFGGLGYYPEKKYIHLDLRPGEPIQWKGKE